MSEEETKTTEEITEVVTETPTTTAVATRGTYSLTEMKDMARVFFESGMFKDLKTAAQAFVKIKAGEELGLQAIYSMQRLYMVEGKLGMSAETMGALIKRSRKYNYRVKEHTDEKCTVVFYEEGQEAYISTFTIQDAKRANLIKPGSAWQKYPRALLFARALSQGGRIVCPDVLGGGYTLEELESIKGDAPPTRAEVPPFVTPPAIPEGVAAAGNTTSADNTAEVDPDNPYSHYLDTCPEHEVDWYHNKFGKRCHKDGDQWCNLSEQLKPVVKSRALLAGFSTPAELNTWLKENYDGRTWSKLTEEEWIDALYKLDQESDEAVDAVMNPKPAEEHPNPVVQAAIEAGGEIVEEGKTEE